MSMPAGTLVRGGLDAAEAQRVILLLASMGIEATIAHDAYGAHGVYAANEDVDAARRVLLSDDSDERNAPLPSYDKPSVEAPSGWFGRGSAAVFAVAAACVAVFAASMQGEAAGRRARWLELGAIERARVAAGEEWRLLTAVFLHFDFGHLLSNLSVLLFVGPPLAHWIGPWRFLLVFVASGVGGNVASYFLAPGFGLRAGSSGAIAGVLGALGGQALRPSARPRRRKTWQTLGALAALYGMLVGFAPQSDHVAHVAGLLIGIALGRIISAP